MPQQPARGFATRFLARDLFLFVSDALAGSGSADLALAGAVTDALMRALTHEEAEKCLSDAHFLLQKVAEALMSEGGA